MKIKQTILAVTSAILLCGSVAVAQVPSREARVDLRVAGQALKDVVGYLRDRSGANIVVLEPLDGDPENPIANRKVVIELTDVPWREALDLVAESVQCVVEERTAGVLAVTAPERVEITAEDGDVRVVIDMIAKAANANIVVGPEVAGTISVRFKGVPWRDALEVVAKTLGYTVVEENRGVLRVVDPLKLQDQMATYSYQLRYLRPRGNYVPVIKSEFVAGKSEPPTGKTHEHFTVLGALEKALSPSGELDYIEDQNVVIIRDTSQVHAAITDMLARLDVEPLQIFVDVKFVSTTNSDLLNLGVDYGDSGPQVSMTGGAIPITFPFNEGSGGWEDWFIASPDGKGPYVDSLSNAGGTVIPDTIFGALSFTQVQATLRLLQRDSKTEVIQAPKLIALDGRESTIFVGETIRYAEAKSEQGQAGGLQLSVQEAGASPVEVGFQLLVRPQVIPGTEKVIMEVIPKETSLSGTGSSALAPPGFDVFTIGASGLEGSIALPRTRSSTIVTTMILDSGQTAVIGGLTTDSDTETESRVPGLSRIPLIGALFRHEVKSRDRRSLMVFVTPTVVHSREDTAAILEHELRRRHTRLRDELETLIGEVQRAAEEPTPEPAPADEEAAEPTEEPR